MGDVYAAMIRQTIPAGFQRDAILADLDDVMAQVATFAPEPSVVECPLPPVTAAVISSAESRALRDGKSILGFEPL